ncbi:MAG TPA: glycosyltransferase, partial [Mesorhizobium sp.]
AEIFFPELTEWQSVLARLSVPLQTAVEIAVRARSDASDFQSAMLACGVVTHSSLLRAVADDLGIGIVDVVDPDKLVLDGEQAIALLRSRNGQAPVKLVGSGGGIVFLITPERLQLDAMRKRIAAQPMLARFLRMADPQILRDALLERARPELARTAKNSLFERFPHLSARIVANAWQGSLAGALVTALPVALLLARDSLLSVAHIAATFFFFACIALRFAALASFRPAAARVPVKMPDGEKPVYSVLVALYREAALIPDLLASLDRLVWPRGRLDIKLVCEADDIGTLAAIRAGGLPAHIELVEVPKGGPRTKPKALAYALQTARGEFVVLYDAEDDPHPMQLVDAWLRFRMSGPDLAAVQAPLEISNRHDSLVARLFAFEYAGLFRGMLPWLSSRRLMLPLGGTSNHFRRTALEAVGGWDPFNVTEDADLGMRLARFGYRTEVISCPTREPAPKRFGIWLPQRTRWFKGWSQTWLVHMRDPFRLMREIGFKSFLIAQVLFAGMLASALLHPLLLVTFVVLTVQLRIDHHLGTLHSLLFIFDVVNIACGYLSFLLLGWQTLTKAERKDFWKIVLFTPPYWVMLSLAGWRALWHLLRRPHHWEKTPHEPNRQGRSGRAGLRPSPPEIRGLRR